MITLLQNLKSSKIVLLFALLFSIGTSAAPPPVPNPVFPLCENFNSYGQFGTEMNVQGGWTGGTGNFKTYVVHGIGNSVGMALNINQFVTEDNIFLPPVGPIPTGTTVSISYRIASWAGGLPISAYSLSPNDSVTLTYVSQNMSSFEVININSTTHVDTLGFRTITVPLNVNNNDTGFFQLFAVADYNSGLGDFWIDIDSVCINNPAVTSLKQISTIDWPLAKQTSDGFISLQNPNFPVSHHVTYYSVFDVAGNRLHNGQMAQADIIDVSAWKSGLYFFSYQIAGQTRSQKLMLVH